jgi:sugar transferase (PEP-CTERM system associated)
MLMLAVCELLLASAAVHLAALVRFIGEDLPYATESFALFVRSANFGVVVVAMLTAMGLYQAHQRLKIEHVMVRVVLALLLAAMGLSLVYYAVPGLIIGRGWLALSLGWALLLLAVSRATFARLVNQNVFRRRVLVYGTGKRAARLLELRRRSDQRGFRIVAFVPVPQQPHLIHDERVDRSPGDLAKLARKHDVEEIVIAMDDRRHCFPNNELLECKFAGIDVLDIVTFLERESGKVNVDLIGPSYMILSEGFTTRRLRSALFRLLDLGVSVTLLLLGWPVMLLTALAILIEDGRPVLYRQTRVGMLGKPFELLKFRSMRKDAEKDGARWATRNDARVTRVGALIRKLRIDELPQLLNVIRGDMRFIGPRPERPDFVRALASQIPYYNERHRVKPGLTGWAQLCYPYGSSEKDALEKLKFDLYYVKNQGLVFDLMILLQTVEVVLWGKGAR